MPEPDHYQANLMRGSLLLDQDRPREALPFFQAAIAANPDDARGYAELARCWNEIPAERHKAIAAIDRAIGLSPHVSYLHGRRGWFYVCLMQYRTAKKAADDGLAINPTCFTSLNALANAYTKLGKWKMAEETCHRILALDPFDAPGLNLLAQAQRHQGKWKESRETVARLLANMPNSAFGHANAGYAALAAGDHLRANEHFRESLRMNPHFDLARTGLLSSLRARVWTTRLNLKIIYLIRRPATFRNALIFIGVVFGVVVAAYFIGLALDRISPNLSVTVLGGVVMGGISYILLSLMVSFMMNVLLLFDPVGRHALTKSEKSKMLWSLLRLVYVVFVLSCGVGLLLLPVALLIVVTTIYFPVIRDCWQRRSEEAANS